MQYYLKKYSDLNEAAIKNVKCVMWIPYKGGQLEITINKIIQEVLLHDEGGNSLTDKAKHDCLYKLMEKYGRLDTACREWRFKTTAPKTWDLCAKHFTKHIKD